MKVFSFFSGLMLILGLSCSQNSIGNKNTDHSSPNEQVISYQISYIANEGVLLEIAETKIIIDALHDPYLDLYLPTPDSLKTKMLAAQSPFEDIDLCLITHVHKDHFSARTVGRYLQQNPQTVLIGSPQIKDSLGVFWGTSEDFLTGMKVVNPDTERNTWKFDNCLITAFPLAHTYPQRNAWVQNAAYLIQSRGISMLHLGDAQLSEQNLKKIEAFANEKVEVAIIPFWFLYDKGWKWLKDQLQFQHIVAVHVPIPDAASLEQEMEAQGPRIRVFNEVGESLHN